VETALDELAEEYRTVIILREMEGLSYEEIAELVACPVGTVRSRIHRARSDLREKLTRALASER
jgi:RNA polymerase sigma-70 factor (ECF subfamily)